MKRISTIVLSAAVAATLAGCGGSSDSSSSSGLDDKDLSALSSILDQTYTYEVVTTVGGGSLTYATGSGTQQEDIGESPEGNPWMSVAVGTDFAYVSVQNDDEYGDVTCRIKQDGQVVSENTSSAAYGIATCQYPN